MRFQVLRHEYTCSLSIVDICALRRQSISASRLHIKPKEQESASKHGVCSWRNSIWALLIICFVMMVAPSVMAQTTGTGALTGAATDSKHPQFAVPANVAANGGGFGEITTSQVNPRVIQFALKYAF